MFKSNPAIALTLAASLTTGIALTAGSTSAFAASSISKTSAVKLTAKRSMSKSQVRSKKRKLVARAKSHGGYPNDNFAPAWTAFCYAEFGPNARYPDAGMLQWCLGI